MRRTLTVVTATVTLTVLNALPALAAGAGGDEFSKGSPDGLVLTLVFGVLAGVGLTIHAYRGIHFGDEPGHQDQAGDIRQGMSDYEPDLPETEHDVSEMERETPSGTA